MKSNWCVLHKLNAADYEITRTDTGAHGNGSTHCLRQRGLDTPRTLLLVDYFNL